MVGNTSAATSGSLRVAASLSVATVGFPVLKHKHKTPRSCLLIAAHHYISTISQYLVQDTSASAVVLRPGTVQCGPWWVGCSTL